MFFLYLFLLVLWSILDCLFHLLLFLNYFAFNFANFLHKFLLIEHLHFLILKQIFLNQQILYSFLLNGNSFHLNFLLKLNFISYNILSILLNFRLDYLPCFLFLLVIYLISLIGKINSMSLF